MNKFVMLVGFSGSKKSEYANELKKQGYVIHSSTELRKKMQHQRNYYETHLFKQLGKNILNDLTNGKNVVYDATNLSNFRRVKMLNKIKNVDCVKECIIFNVSVEKCVENLELLKSQGEKIYINPKRIVSEQYINYEVPTYNEGWDKIYNKTDKELVEVCNEN